MDASDPQQWYAAVKYCADGVEDIVSISSIKDFHPRHAKDFEFKKKYWIRYLVPISFILRESLRSTRLSSVSLQVSKSALSVGVWWKFSHFLGFFGRF